MLGSKHGVRTCPHSAPLDLPYWTKGRKPGSSDILLKSRAKIIYEEELYDVQSSGRSPYRCTTYTVVGRHIDGIKGSNGGRMSLNSFQVITAPPDKMMDLASLWLLNQFSTFMGK